MKRRSFFASMAACIAAPWLPVPKPTAPQRVTYTPSLGSGFYAPSGRICDLCGTGMESHSDSCYQSMRYWEERDRNQYLRCSGHAPIKVEYGFILKSKRLPDS